MLLKLIRNSLLIVLGIVALGGAVFGYAWFRYVHSWTPVEKVSFESEGVQISGLLVLPKGDGPYPAIVQVAGSGPLGKDHPVPRMHANALAKKGLAVFYYDKRGVGESGGRFYEADYRTFVADIHSAFDYFKTRSDIDATKLGYIGHSEGGHLMPEVALARDDIKFAYIRVGPVLGYRHFANYQYRHKMKQWRMQPDEIEKVIEFSNDVADFYIRSVGDAEYYRGSVRDALQKRLDAIKSKHPTTAGQLFGRRVGNSAYLDGPVRRIPHSRSYEARKFLEQNPSVSMFYVFGELDVHVDTNTSIAYLNDLRDRTGQDIEYYVYKGDDHTMNKWYHLPFGTYQPGYFDRMTDWIIAKIAEA